MRNNAFFFFLLNNAKFCDIIQTIFTLKKSRGQTCLPEVVLICTYLFIYLFILMPLDALKAMLHHKLFCHVHIYTGAGRKAKRMVL